MVSGVAEEQRDQKSQEIPDTMWSPELRLGQRSEPEDTTVFLVIVATVFNIFFRNGFQSVSQHSLLPSALLQVQLQLKEIR